MRPALHASVSSPVRWQGLLEPRGSSHKTALCECPRAWASCAWPDDVVGPVQGFEMESLEPDLLMDPALMEPSISLPLPMQHHAPHSDSLHLPNGSLDHHLLDPLHDLSGGDEDYKRMLQMLVPPTLPTSSCAPPPNPPPPPPAAPPAL